MSIGRIAFLLIAVFGVLGSLHYYAWTRLVRDAQLPAPWSMIATAVLVALFVMLASAMPASYLLPRRLSSPLIWGAFIWLGFAFFFVVLFASSDLARLLLGFARKALDQEPPDAERRLLVTRILAAAVSLGAIALGVAGLVDGLHAVRVKRIRVSLRRIRPTRVGYTIAQISDVHVGPTIGRAFIEEIVAKTNALKADLIVITGDLVDGSVARLGDAVAPLANLRAKDGVFFVTGNHEYYSGVDEWIAYLTTLGIRVLRNERVSIGGSDGFDIAGVDDWGAASFGNGHGANLDRALQGRDRGRVLILLAHQPKQVYEAAHADVDLQLSGHTHGGQMFPFNLFVKLQQPYVSGFHMHEGTGIYVSNGTGYWGPPMRVGAPAEITHIELRMS
jgi:predicted MPP superfamily phosphohydrolase